jgi:hypothetical protein
MASTFISSTDSTISTPCTFSGRSFILKFISAHQMFAIGHIIC